MDSEAGGPRLTLTTVPPDKAPTSGRPSFAVLNNCENHAGKQSRQRLSLKRETV